MDISNDSRYQQIQKEAERETQSQASLRAFTGWGRTTQLIQETDEIGKKNQERISLLASVISLEAMARSGADVGKALAAAQESLSKANTEAAKRRAEIANNLLGAGNAEETKHQVALKYRKTFKQKGLTIQKTTHYEFKPQKLETVKKLENIKPLSTLTSIGQSGGFSTLKTLVNY